MKINLSKPKDYHTQRNNKFHPLSTCNVTATVNALLASGYDLDFCEGQPEDCLFERLESKSAQAYMAKHYEWAVKAQLQTRFVHQMLVWSVEQLMNEKGIVEFKTDATMIEILSNILNGGAVNMSGQFTSSGHIVTIVGFETKQNQIFFGLDNVETIIVDDSYGNFHTAYEIKNGNDIKFSLAGLNGLTKTPWNYRKKWAHLFKKVGES